MALLVEGLLLLALLSLGTAEQPGEKEGGMTVINLEAEEVSQAPPAPDSLEREQPPEAPPVPPQAATEEPLPSQPIEPLPQPAERSEPTAPVIRPTLSEPLPSTDIIRTPTRPAPSGRPPYGPPDRGGSSSRNTERVGTAPNGEPLYAAAWYREPRDDQLRDYLSTASGPGWGLIACRTVPDYRVEDCVGLDEYPRGSQINRALLAAAWEFRVQPPRLGGRTLVGSWVRIRIDYSIGRR